MFKCPFCQSTNYSVIDNDNQRYKVRDFNDIIQDGDFMEVLCNDCGIVTKIDASIYEEVHKDETK